MRYLGVDYGKKKIGLAISDPTGKIAFPFAVLNNGSKLAEQLASLITDEQVDEVVLSESLDYRHQPNPVMAAVAELKDRLEEEFKLKVNLQPEWLTSREAERDIGLDELSHARAAAVMLRSFLETKRST
ncbi:MAG: Holliday junction resolvase RuvX [bacterium]|nr:Holliday junction resolvase RuvX [bacterium]